MAALSAAVQRRITDLTEQLRTVRERTLREQLAIQSPEHPLRYEAGLLACYHPIGLYHWWRGEQDLAQESWRGALAAGQRHLALYRDGGASAPPSWEAGTVRNTAIMANFVGETALALELFAQAERFAAGLRPGEERPRNLAESLDDYAEYPTTRAYCLIRLGRLEGFSSALYRGEPTWQPADIFTLLQESEGCLERTRAKGEAPFRHDQAQIALLRAVARWQAAPGPGLLKEARRALVDYLGKIRQMGDLWSMLHLALDLELAFPTLGPLLPPIR